MDPLKIILFLAAFAALLLVARLLSGMGEVHAASLPHPGPPPNSPQSPTALSNTVLAEPGARAAAMIGSEIPFPIAIPPIQRRKDSTYNRPEILNYFFAKTDLLHGPEDPDSLFDKLTIETRDPADPVPIHYSYTVATPAGLRRAMLQEKLDSLFLDRYPVVVVPRWDLALILQTVVDEMMRVYGVDQEEEEPPEISTESA